jgi:hypothetical protein
MDTRHYFDITERRKVCPRCGEIYYTTELIEGSRNAASRIPRARPRKFITS